MAEKEPGVCKKNICISTLGKFYILHDSEIISASSSRSKRMWEIFKFLISHRGKAFFPEVILDKLWPDNEYNDPNLVMRAQIFRLRQALNSAPGKPTLAANIVFSQGCYSWEDKTDYWLDSIEFESLAEEAGSLSQSDRGQAINLYRRVAALYKGEYLPELSFSEWLEPIRTYYHEIYLDCVLNLIDLLKAQGDYTEIIKVCEQAAAIDYFEEKIHIKLIEALLADEQTTRARAHYNEVTTVFYREMGIKPSEHMKNLYRQVGVERGNFELDLATIQEGLKGKEAVNGAYLCDAELFRYFYKLERLRFERNGNSILLGLLTLTAAGCAFPDKKILKAVMQDLEGAILDSLRKGDVVTRWNEAQFLMLLPGLNREQAGMVIERIVNNFHRKHSLRGLTLHRKIESLMPLEGDAHFS